MAEMQSVLTELAKEGNDNETFDGDIMTNAGNDRIDCDNESVNAMTRGGNDELKEGGEDDKNELPYTDCDRKELQSIIENYCKSKGIKPQRMQSLITFYLSVGYQSRSGYAIGKNAEMWRTYNYSDILNDQDQLNRWTARVCITEMTRWSVLMAYLNTETTLNLDKLRYECQRKYSHTTLRNIVVLGKKRTLILPIRIFHCLAIESENAIFKPEMFDFQRQESAVQSSVNIHIYLT
eukprot:351759_1